MVPPAADAITAFHVHVYYHDAAERERAAVLREALMARFAVTMGRWHDQPVEPRVECLPR